MQVHVHLHNIGATCIIVHETSCPGLAAVMVAVYNSWHIDI